MKKAEDKEKEIMSRKIETVVKIINAHINNADVCEKACGTLRNMTTDRKFE